MTHTRVHSIWDPIVRLCHWGIVVSVIVNYFIVEPGRLLHEIAGYFAMALITIRIVWGMARSSSSFASFAHFNITPAAIKRHYHHLKIRNIPSNSGHNPFGWLMIVAVVILIVGLTITGFMMEEVDAFFGNSKLEFFHSIMADTLYGLALVHIAAVLFVQWWGNIALVKPMLFGKRKH